MTDAWLPRRLVYAPLDVLNAGDGASGGAGADPSARLRPVPSQQPLLADREALLLRHPDLQTVHSEYAAHASGCSTSGSRDFPAAFFFARAIDDGTILELRWMKTAAGAQAQQQPSAFESSLPDEASAPELFEFPAPLLGKASLFADERTGTLQVLAVTVTGYLYRLSFRLPELFYARSLPNGWATEHRITGLAGVDEQGRQQKGRVPQRVAAVHPGLVLVTCNDGTIVKVQQSGSSKWEETLLQTTSFVRNLTRIFGRSAPGASGSSHEPESTPLTALSIATHASDRHSPFAFVISQDRRLRVWDLTTDACVRTLDLPTAAASWKEGEADWTDAADASTSRQGDGYLGTNAKPLMEVVAADRNDDSGHDAYLMVHVPASGGCGNFFVYYGLELLAPKAGSASNALGDITRIWDARCEPDTRTSEHELRDIAVLSFGVTGLRLWALWDDNGSPLLKSIVAMEDAADVDASYLSVAAHTSPAPWSTVTDWRPFTPLHGAAFEASISVVDEHADDVRAFFSNRIFEAGRFSERALRAALAEYEDALLQRQDESEPLPWPLAPETTFDTVEAHLAAVVGCTDAIEMDPATGNALMAQHIAALKREWMMVLGLIEQFESAAKWPLALIRPDAHPSRSSSNSERHSLPLIATRDYVAAIAVEDAASAVLRISTQVHEGADPQLAWRALVTAKSAAAEQAFLTGEGSSSAKTRSVLTATLEAAEDHGSAVFSLLNTAQSLAQSVPATRLELFEHDLHAALSGKLGESIEDAVASIWSSSLEDVIGSDAFDFLAEACAELGESLDENLLRWADLLLEGLAADQEGISSIAPIVTELETAFVTDHLSAVLASRRSSAVLLTLLLASIWVSNGIERSVPSLPTLLARSTSVMHLCEALHHLAGGAGTPDAAPLIDTASEESVDEDGLTRQFSGMNMAARSSDRIGASKSALHFACQRGFLSAREVPQRDDNEDVDAQYLDLTIAKHSLATFTALLAPVADSASGLVLGLSPPLSSLAHRLLQDGWAGAVDALIAQFPSSAAGAYLQGCVALARGLPDAAMAAFDRVLFLLDSEEALLDDESGLLGILPPAVARHAPGQRALALFNRHAGNLFGAVGSVEGIAKYGSAALAHGLDEALSHSPGAVSEVWFSTFRAHLQLGDFKAAYRTIMSSTDESFKRDCIRSLVTTMCEAGHVATLLTFNFAGSQGELERTLSFKARNSDPFATPNYFKILYAYHMNRGDLKSAGAVMYQQSHQLATLQRLGYRVAVRGQEFGQEQFEDIASVQARSFLAAINVLSLVHARDAWFANVLPSDEKTASGGSGSVAAMEEDGAARADSLFADGASQATSASSSSRTTQYIPASEFTAGNRPIEIIRLEDIKREYQLLLARLELSRGYAELAAPRSKLSAADAVALYLRSDRYDQALATARALGVDTAGIFASLAGKCVALSQRAAWRKDALAKATAKAAAAGADDGDSDDDDDEEAVSGGGGARSAALAPHPSLQRLADELEGQEDEGAAFLLHSERSCAWDGSPADKAWRYLRLQLDVYDGLDAPGQHGVNGTSAKGGRGRGHVAALQRALELGGREHLPEWLLEWFRTNKPDLLIRAYMRAGLTVPALEEALALLKRPLAADSSRAHKASRGQQNKQQQHAADLFVPYTLIDELVLLAEEGSDAAASASASAPSEAAPSVAQRARLRELASSVRGAARERVQRAGRAEERARREAQDEARAEDGRRARAAGKDGGAWRPSE